MESSALHMSEFDHDMREQMKIETSRTVKIVMLTYRCILAICMVACAQFIFIVVTKVIQEKEIDDVMKLVSSNLESESEFVKHV
jgi:hypothetical protein